MIRVATLRFAIIAGALAAVALAAGPARSESAPASSSSPLTLTLKEAQVQDVIRMLARAAGADVLMTDDVQGTISVEVSEKTPEEVLDIVCKAKKIHWWKENGVYVVSGKPRTTDEARPASDQSLARSKKARANQQLRIDLQYAKAQDLCYLFGTAKEPYTEAYKYIDKFVFPYGAPGEKAGIPLGAQSKDKPAPDTSAKTAAAITNRNPFDQLSQITLPGVIQPAPGAPGAATTPAAPGEVAPTTPEEEQIYLNPSAPLAHLLPEDLSPPVAFAPMNALIVQGTPEAIEQFRKLVEMLDVRVPQVMVEAQFVEMTVSDARQFGIDWSWIGTQTSMDVTGIAGGGTISVSYAKGRFTALLQTLLTNNRARVINAPRLATMNNQPVTFTISRTFFYFTTSSVVQPPGFAGSQVISNEILNALPVVTTFTILPQVNGDNSITVDVTTVISDIAGFVTSPSGQQIPQPTATSLPTRLRVEDGETIVMGGFVRKNISTSTRKVPLLSDIPIIGKALFTGTNYSYSDDELLIFLTAYIMPDKTAAPGATPGARVPFTEFPLAK
jgi:type II secretory pathway component GspD/PulD (secretin)